MRVLIKYSRYSICISYNNCPHDCLCDCLIDHLHLITSKLRDQLHDQLCILNSDIAKAQDPGLSPQEAMDKDRWIIRSLIIQCCTTCMYMLYIDGLTDDGSLDFSLWISPSSGEIPWLVVHL